MNAIPLGLEESLPREPFAAATARVNEWRGRCLDSLTRAEAAVTECLETMAGVDGRGHQVQLLHLVGQRLEALAAAIGVHGPFQEEGSKAASALAQFREYAGFRNMICHGTSRITLDPKGRWTVVIRLTTFRPARVERETLALTEVEAVELGDSMIRASRELCSRLGQVRAGLR